MTHIREEEIYSYLKIEKSITYFVKVVEIYKEKFYPGSGDNSATMLHIPGGDISRNQAGIYEMTVSVKGKRKINSSRYTFREEVSLVSGTKEI